MPLSALRIFTLLCLALRLTAAEPLPDIPDPLGRAGMMAAVLKDTDGQEVILAAGGCNFPGKMPWDGGTKVFYTDIFLLKKTAGKWAWRLVGQLPTPTAYAAFAATPTRDGLVIAGGCNADGHLTAVLVVKADGQCTPLTTPLREPRAYAGCLSVGSRLIISGGTPQPTSTAALATMTVLDLAKPTDGWKSTDDKEEFARILPLVGADENGIVLWAGGCALSADQGKPLRDYRDALTYNKPNGQGTKFHALPTPLAASAGPGVAAGNHLFFVGGDDGKHYGKPPATHPGQSTQVLAIDTETLEVQVVDQWPHPVATAPLLRLGDDLVTISGETRPGVRTPACTRWTIPAKLR